jgi:predicted esterase
MRWWLPSLLMLCAALPVTAEVPPLQVPIGEMVEGISCISDPTQTYTLFIPSEFSNDRTWPVLLVFDPRGRSLLAAELFREASEAYGWIIVSSDNTRSDGPMEPNVTAVQALWPEIHTRLPADFNRIYAAGFSGGAAVAYSLSKVTREIAGIIACGGRFLPDELRGNDVPIFATTGDVDFNYREMHLLNDFLTKQDNPHRLVIFEGTHSWMPSAVARQAVEWFELVAMRRGLRTVDPALIDHLFSQDLVAANTAKEEGRFLTSARILRDMEQTYSGLHGIDEVKLAADEVESDAEFRRQRKDHKRWDNFEREYHQDMNRWSAEIRNAEILPPNRRLALGLRIAELQQKALRPGYEGVVARRSLNALESVLSFYLPRDFMAVGRYDRAATSLELAVRLRDDNPVLWYNLACCHARAGHEARAMEALAEALDLGFNRAELLATDEDLDSLRDREDFKALLATVPAS